MSADYAYWTARLNGEDVPHPDLPQPGRYRLPARRTNQTGNVYTAPPKSWPVAIWRDDQDGKMRVLIGPTRLLREDEKVGDDIPYLAFVDAGWPRCVPVPTEQYDAVIGGAPWPDEHAAVTNHNQAPPDDSYDALSERIHDLGREAATLIEKGAAKTKEECDQAADLANLLGQLEKRAEDVRKREKQPLVEAGAAIDARWKPVIGQAAIGKSGLKIKVVTPYLTEVERQRREEEFKQLTLGTPPEQAAQPKATAGTRGRPISMRSVTTVTITDRAALLAHFAEHEEVTALLQTLAERAVKAKMAVPGVKVETNKVAA